MMGRAIFISYRRDDAEGEAGRLFDDLVRAYNENSVFMDVAGINPGMDFRKAIDDNVATCGVLLAVIGPAWATIANSAGHRRLDDENDFVRLEVASALARNIPVIPVLVHDAKMPRPEELPDNLKDLAYRNSVELTHARWNSDVQLLTTALKQYVAASSATGTDPIHATVPVQLPPANADATKPTAARTSKMPLVAGIAVVVLLAIAAVVYFAMRPAGANRGGTAQSPATAAPATGGSNGTAGTTGSQANRVDAAALAGVWTNSGAVERNGLKKLAITVQGDRISVEAWAQCPGADCDWGVEPATFDGQKATAIWSIDVQSKEDIGRQATVTMAPANGALRVTVDNRFSTGESNQRQRDFVRGQ